MGAETAPSRHHPTPGSRARLPFRRAGGGLRSQAGLTLIELLVAMTAMMVVVGAVLAMLNVAQPAANRELQRDAAINDQRAGLVRMVHELRMADTVNATSPNVIDVNAPVDGSEHRLVYECDTTSALTGYRTCRRYTGPVGGSVSSSGQVIIDRLVNGTASSPVFTYYPDNVRPLRIAIHLVVPAKADAKTGYTHSIALDDGVYLRNVDLSGS